MRQSLRLGELQADLPLHAYRFGPGQLGQALHPRLRLPRLAGLGLETVDELLQVLALGLFLLEGDLLLAQLLGALALECGVTPHVQARALLVQVHGVGGHVVQELAVVRNQQQRARILQQPLLQPQHRVQVQVVGGLVQQQQVAGHHQRARQVQPDPPTAGERRHRLVVRGRGKPQAMQQAACTRSGVVAVHLLQPVVGGGHRLPILAGQGLGLGPDRGRHLGIAGQDEIDGRVGQRGGFLGDAGDAGLAGQLHVALVGLQFTGNRREQAGLAGAIAADQADPVACMQGHVHTGQQQPSPPAQGEIAKRNHAPF